MNTKALIAAAVIASTLGLTGCSGSSEAAGPAKATYADGEEVAREALQCDEVLETTDSITGPDTGCKIGDAHVSIWDWGTASDDYRKTFLDEWQDAGYVIFKVGDQYSVLVRSTDDEAVAAIKKRLG